MMSHLPCAGVRISLGTCVYDVCVFVYVCVWLLAFGTVCEMIFHLAFLAICFSSLEQLAKPPASNFFYQSQLIMQVVSMGACVCVFV